MTVLAVPRSTAMSRRPKPERRSNMRVRERSVRRYSSASAASLGRRSAREEGRTPCGERGDVAVASVQVAVAERVLGLHHLVDLRRALVDDRGAGVAEIPLDAVFARVAVRSVDLDREVGGAEGRLGRVPLGQARLAGVANAL